MPEIQFDARMAFLILIFAAVFTAVQAVVGLARVGVARRKVNKRLVAALRAKGVNAVGLSAIDGGIAVGRRGQAGQPLLQVVHPAANGRVVGMVEKLGELGRAPHHAEIAPEQAVE